MIQSYFTCGFLKEQSKSKNLLPFDPDEFQTSRPPNSRRPKIGKLLNASISGSTYFNITCMKEIDEISISCAGFCHKLVGTGTTKTGPRELAWFL